MTVLDYAVLAIIGLSILISILRGLVREVLALVAWGAGFIAASLWAADLAVLLPPEIPGDQLRLLAGFTGVFLGVLVAMSLLAILVSKLVKSAGLGVEDRMLGGVFGLVRGVLVVMVFALLAGLTSLPRQPVWRDAVLSEPLEAFAGHIKRWLPTGFGERIRYE